MCSPKDKDNLEGYSFDEIVKLERDLNAAKIALGVSKEIIEDLKKRLLDMEVRKEFFAELLNISIAHSNKLETLKEKNTSRTPYKGGER